LTGTTQKYQSFVVPMWANFFKLASFVSTFFIFNQLLIKPFFLKKQPDESKKPSKDFIADCWTLFHLILAIACVCLIDFGNGTLQCIGYLIAYYGIARTIELVIYQINVLLFDQFRTAETGDLYRISGYRRLVLLLIQNYVETVAWFTAIHFILANKYDWISLTSESLVEGLSRSLKLMATFSFTNGNATTLSGEVVILAQSCIGVFMTLVILARFVSFLPKPESLDSTERQFGDNATVSTNQPKRDHRNAPE